MRKLKDPVIIEEMYKILPEESRGREAINPEWFQWYLNPHGSNASSWPYAILCEETSGKLSWHIGCSDYVYDYWVVEEGFYLDDRISRRRDKKLRILEMLSRSINMDKGFMHYTSKEDGSAVHDYFILKPDYLEERIKYLVSKESVV